MFFYYINHFKLINILIQSYTTCIVCDSNLRECLQISNKFCSGTTTSTTSNVVTNRPRIATSTTNAFNSMSNTSTFSSNSNLTSINNTNSNRRYNTTSSSNSNQNSNFTSMNNNNSLNDSNDNSENNNPIVCYCSNSATLLTVRKEGPNQGRQFYSCSSKACNFFHWADAPMNNDGGDDSFNNRNSNRTQASTSTSTSGRGTVCSCGTVPKM